MKRVVVILFAVLSIPATGFAQTSQPTSEPTVCPYPCPEGAQSCECSEDELKFTITFSETETLTNEYDAARNLIRYEENAEEENSCFQYIDPCPAPYDACGDTQWCDF